MLTDTEYVVLKQWDWMKYEKSWLHYQEVTTSETQWNFTLHWIAFFSDKINRVDQINSHGLNYEVLQIINIVFNRMFFTACWTYWTNVFLIVNRKKMILVYTVIISFYLYKNVCIGVMLPELKQAERQNEYESNTLTTAKFPCFYSAIRFLQVFLR